MYAAPPVIQTEIHATLPRELHNTEKYSAWVAERRAGKLHSFLEGPTARRATSPKPSTASSSKRSCLHPAS